MKKILFDEILSEGSLHECIRNDHTHPTGRRFVMRLASKSQVKKPLRERNAELVLTPTSREAASVRLAQNWVAYVNVRWVSDNNVVRLAEYALQFFRIFRVIKVLKTILEDMSFDAAAEAGPVQQRIAFGKIESKVRSVPQSLNSAGFESCDE